jgi:hypothetical protein
MRAGKHNSRPPRGKFQGSTRMFGDDDRSGRNSREIARIMDKNTQDPSAAAGSDKPPRGSFTSFMKASHFSFMQHHRRFWVLLSSVAGSRVVLKLSIVTIHHSTLLHSQNERSSHIIPNIKDPSSLSLSVPCSHCS